MVSTAGKKSKNNTFSSRLKNVFSLAGMKWFPLISVTVSANRKELSSRRFPLKRKTFHNIQNEEFVKKYVSTRRKKAYHLYQPENPFPLPGMKHSFKTPFPLYGKTASFSLKIENGFHQQENIFLLKLIHPNFIHGFQQQKKSIRTKAYCFHQAENKFPLAGMKDSLKHIFSLDLKVTFGGSNV